MMVGGELKAREKGERGRYKTFTSTNHLRSFGFSGLLKGFSRLDPILALIFSRVRKTHFYY